MSEGEREPLGEIEIGLSIEQATAIVREFDVLWQHGNIHGKKKVKQLWGLRNQLADEVEITDPPAVHAVLKRQKQTYAREIETETPEEKEC